ncbi:MAG: hypothetical protein IJP38_05825, partial [Oscillospiraceae bacterium]|nr:hypothetical protein [Oscillospiraceae bacterium]
SALLRHLVSLWLGHVAVLIVHRTIIHCRADTPLTLRYLKGKALVDIPPPSQKTTCIRTLSHMQEIRALMI